VVQAWRILEWERPGGMGSAQPSKLPKLWLRINFTACDCISEVTAAGCLLQTNHSKPKPP